MIDTVGVKTGSALRDDRSFGTPYTKSLHVVERYRLREYDDGRRYREEQKRELAIQWRCLQQPPASSASALMVEDEGVSRPVDRDSEYVPT